jgi:hypothetical protein
MLDLRLRLERIPNLEVESQFESALATARRTKHAERGMAS